MNHKTVRMVALFLTLVMILGTIAILPFNVSAYDGKKDTAAPGTGAEVPAETPIYDGTPSNTLTQDGDGVYLIQSAADFVYFHNTVAATAAATDVFKLTCDIALNDANYGASNVHTALTTMVPFAGTLDGAGHKIYNMYSCVGKNGALFGALNGTVENLIFVSPRLFNTSTNNAERISVVADQNVGIIKNVEVVDAYLDGRNAAGIAYSGWDGSVVTDCIVSGVVKSNGTSTNYAAGIVGIHDGVKAGTIYIDNCVNRATVSTGGSAAGGIFASDGDANTSSGWSISNCVNYGNITAKSEAGGIIGRSYRAGKDDITDISYCVNYGKVSTTSSTGISGGIAGAVPTAGSNRQHDHVNIIGCENHGAVVSPALAGGIIGSNGSTGVNTSIIDTTNYGTVTGGTYAGGLVGRLYGDHSHGYARLNITNSANHGNVSAAIVGGIVGEFVARFSDSSKLVVDGFLSTADITGVDKAAAITGEFNYEYTRKTGTKDFLLNDVWMQGAVSVSSATGVVAAFTNTKNYTVNKNVYSFQANTTDLYATNCGFDLTFSVAGAAVENVVSYNYFEMPAGATFDTSSLASMYEVTNAVSKSGYNNGTEDVAAAYPVADASTFAASALASLNATAGEGRATWSADDTNVAKMTYVSFAMINADGMSHAYTGKAIEPAFYINNADIVSVVNTYYTAADGYAVALDYVPVLPGTYRVISQAKNASGENVGASVTKNYTIGKGVVRFELTEKSLIGLTDVPNYYGTNPIDKYSAPFKGSPYVFTAIAYDGARGKTTLCILEDNMPHSSIQNYNESSKVTTDVESALHTNASSKDVYYIHFTYPEDELYNSYTCKWQLQILTTTFTYPAADTEGRWNIPTSNGTEQKVTLNFLEGEAPADIFDITYGGDYTATYMADGVTQNATAALSLKPEFANDCTIEGTAPAYSVDWRMDTNIGFTGATMSLGGNMALNMKLSPDALAGFGEGFKVAFVDANGDGVEATLNNGYYTVSYTGIRAAELANAMELHIVVSVGDAVYTSVNTLTYSPLIYLVNLYTDYSAGGEKADEANAQAVLNVVASMINYGAAAEAKEKGISVTDTVIATLTGASEALLFELTSDMYTNEAMTDEDKAAINAIADTGATLTGGINVTFTMKDAAYTTLTVNDITYTAQDGKFEITCIHASMIRSNLRLSFSGEGVDTVTANFTVGNFLESRRANADETALAEATILYMMAARAYVLATQA